MIVLTLPVTICSQQSYMTRVGRSEDTLKLMSNWCYNYIYMYLDVFICALTVINSVIDHFCVCSILLNIHESDSIHQCLWWGKFKNTITLSITFLKSASRKEWIAMEHNTQHWSRWRANMLPWRLKLILFIGYFQINFSSPAIFNGAPPQINYSIKSFCKSK